MSLKTIPYKVRPIANETLAMEALHIAVKKHVEGAMPIEAVKNTLQEYREDIDASLSDLARVDAKLAGEYLDDAMANKYRQRIADLSGVLLASSSILSFKTNRGDYKIISNIQTALARKQLAVTKGKFPLYKDASKYVSSIRLFIKSLRIIQSYTNLDFFKESKDVDMIFDKTKGLLSSFDSPFGKLKTTGESEEFSLEWETAKPSTADSFEKAGWSVEKLTDYQTVFSNTMMELSKVLYEASQAINRFNMMVTVARSLGYFSIYAERLTEALNRLPAYFIEVYKTPFVSLERR